MYKEKWFEKYVYCPLCRNGWSILKYTKTQHLMLRCDECKVLIFANSPDSQDELLKMCNIGISQNLNYDFYSSDEFNY
jgi:hypothetical protein